MSGHAARQFHPDTWDIIQSTRLAEQLTAGATLAELGHAHPEIVCVAADLGGPTRLKDFAAVFPDRFFNFGIAEKNMVSVAAGLATTGKIPYMATYASFLALLAGENIRTDVCYTNLPVRMIGTHSGIAMGFYGSSHHATEDIAFLRAMANLTIISPPDGRALSEAIRATVKHPGPIYFRFGRGREPEVYPDGIPGGFRMGKAVTLRQGKDLTIIATGLLVHAALAAAEELASEGVSATVVDMMTLKPLDADAVVAAARVSGRILTCEEHNIYGGLGGAVAEVLAQSDVPCRLRIHGIRDEYSLIGPPFHLYSHYGLDGAGVAREARRLLRAD